MKTQNHPTILTVFVRVLCLTIGLLAALPSAHAQLYWNTNGTLATWTSANWNTANSAPYTTAWAGSSDVVFNPATGGTNQVTFATATAGNITVNADTTVTAVGTLSSKSGGSIVDVANGVTLTWLAQQFSATAANQIWTKNGGGTWNMTSSGRAASSSGSSFTLNAGTIIASGNNNFGAANGSLIINGGTIQASGTPSWANSVTFGGNVEFTKTNTGTAAFNGAISLGASTRTITNSTTDGLVNLNGIISGGVGAGLIFVGSGSRLSLSGANTYDGGTTLSSGTLQVGVNSVGVVGAVTNGAVGTGTLALNGGTLSSASTTGRTLLNAVTVGGNVTLGDATNNGTITLSAGVNLGGSARTLTTASALNLDGDVSNGGITKDGSSTLKLSGANTYSGGTIINAGIVTINSANLGVVGSITNSSIGTGDLTFNGGSISAQTTTSRTILNAVNFTGNAGFGGVGTGTLAFSANADLGGATRTLTTVVDTTFNGIVSNGGINKDGASTLTLAGTSANIYGGATTISNGTLSLNKTAGVNAISGSSVTVASNATLLLSASNQVIDTATITLSGGTIARASGETETFGDLNLTANSFLNYGSGATNSLNFGTYTGGAFKLTVNNFLAGNVLTFKTDLTTSVTNTSLFAFDNGFSSSWNGGASTFTITAIPEPSTILVAIGLAGVMLWPLRRRGAAAVKSFWAGI